MLLHFFTLTWHWYGLSLINYGQKAFILLAFFFPINMTWIRILSVEIFLWFSTSLLFYTTSHFGPIWPHLRFKLNLHFVVHTSPLQFLTIYSSVKWPTISLTPTNWLKFFLEQIFQSWRSSSGFDNITLLHKIDTHSEKKQWGNLSPFFIRMTTPWLLDESIKWHPL